MAINWMDNFGLYGIGGQARMLNGLYAENNNTSIIADPDPTAGGSPVLRQQGSNAAPVMCRRVLSTARATVGMASRIWLSTLPQDVSRQPVFACFRDVANVDLLWITCDPSGNLQAWNYNNNVPLLIGQSANPVIIANAWQHIETKVLFANGAGTVEVRVEGVTVLNVAGAVTSWNTNPCQNVGPGYRRDVGVVGPLLYIKDFIVWDTTGAFNNDFMGSCQVYKLIPDADVALNWTPNPADGIGYDKINEATPDDDARYIAAPFPLPAAYKCSLTDLPVTVTSVRGVMPIHRSRKTDGGDGNLQVGLISGASTGLGSDRPITTAYTYWPDVYDADPNGGIQWTRLAVNALNLQLNRTA